MTRAEAIEKAARTVLSYYDDSGEDRGFMAALRRALALPQSDHPVLTEAQRAFYEAARAVMDSPRMWMSIAPLKLGDPHYGKRDEADRLTDAYDEMLAAESGAEGGVVQ